MKKYKFSQSALKEFEEEDNCPFRWKAVHVDKTDRYDIGGAADNGNYFEHLCLGTKTGVYSMDKLKSGQSSALEKRIIAQSEVFKNLFNLKHKDSIAEEVVTTDIKLETEKEKGYLDFCSVNLDNGLTWWDLKLVGDLDRGYYKYGNHQNADYTQQIFYKNLLESKGEEDPKMGLIIFESNISARIKIIMLDIGKDMAEMMEKRIERSREITDLYEENGWTKYPSEGECKKCNLECQNRYHPEETQEEPQGETLPDSQEPLAPPLVEVVEVQL